ncbi:hypothetical protein GCM10020001_103870 [Nonomuraea salmonea]
MGGRFAGSAEMTLPMTLNALAFPATEMAALSLRPERFQLSKELLAMVILLASFSKRIGVPLSQLKVFPLMVTLCALTSLENWIARVPLSCGASNPPSTLSPMVRLWPPLVISMMAPLSAFSTTLPLMVELEMLPMNRRRPMSSRLPWMIMPRKSLLSAPWATMAWNGLWKWLLVMSHLRSPYGGRWTPPPSTPSVGQARLMPVVQSATRLWEK